MKKVKSLLIVFSVFISLLANMIVYAETDNIQNEETLEEPEVTVLSFLDIEKENTIELSEESLEDAAANLPTQAKVLLNTNEEMAVEVSWELEGTTTEDETVIYRYRLCLGEGYRMEDNFPEEEMPYTDFVVENVATEDSEDMESVELFAASEEIEEAQEQVLQNARVGGTTVYKFNEGKNTLGDVIGINRVDLLNWLGLHVNDTYYLTTPYAPKDHRNPNGDPAGYGTLDKVGVPMMNCTGFVWHALMKAGANSKTPTYTGWSTFLVNNNIEYRTYMNVTGINDCLSTILTDGYIEPGDLIWTWDASCSVSSVTGMPTATSDEHHIGIYIGKYFDDIKTGSTGDFWESRKDANRWWHSADKALDSSIKTQINRTSKIMPKTACSAVTVIKMSTTSNLVLKKVSSNPGLTNGNSEYSLKGAKYGVYAEAACTNQVATLITDESGNSNSVMLVPNKTYYIKEIEAPKGFVLDTKVYSTVLTANQTITLEVSETPEEKQKLEVSIVKKLKDTDLVIPGAVFRHTFPDGTTEDAKTDENGRAAFTELAEGQHVIEEISVPEGFVKNPGKVTFKVEADNTITLVSNTSSDATGNMRFEVQEDGNASLNVEDLLTEYSLRVTKVNEKDMTLQGAEFTIYSDEACTDIVRQGATDENGLLLFNNLQVGKTYYIKETKAPQGYKILQSAENEDMIYEILTESNPLEDSFEYFVNGNKYVDVKGDYAVTGTKDERTVNLKVVNHSGIEMPRTGTHTALILFVCGAGVMASVILHLLREYSRYFLARGQKITRKRKKGQKKK